MIDITRHATTFARARAAERRAAGLRLRVWRERAGLAQDKAGALLGLSRAQLSAAECGGSSLTADIATRLAAELSEACAPREEVRLVLALVGGVL